MERVGGRLDTLKALAFFLMIPLLVSVGLLLIAGKGDGEFRQEGITRIDQPKDLVFEWLSEPEHRKEWVEGLFSSRLHGTQVEAGAKLDEVLADGSNRSNVKVEVLTADYGELLVLRFTEPGRVVEVRYALAPHLSTRRTRIDLTVSGQLDGWWAGLMEPVLAGRILDRVEEDLARLAEKIRGA
jgi:uncharacterized protein YndB with AHSA1/START domain